MQKAMDLVDEWHRPASRCFIAHALPLALLPGLEFDCTPRAFFRLCLQLLSCGILLVIFLGGLTTGTDQEVELVGQGAVREATRDGVENTRAGWCVVHAEVVAMEQVISGDIIQSAYCFCVSIMGEYTSDDKVHDDAAHMAQELGDGHDLPGL